MKWDHVKLSHIVRVKNGVRCSHFIVLCRICCLIKIVHMDTMKRYHVAKIQTRASQEP